LQFSIENAKIGTIKSISWMKKTQDGITHPGKRLVHLIFALRKNIRIRHEQDCHSRENKQDRMGLDRTRLNGNGIGLKILLITDHQW
jgi:hypothetical protein